MTCSSKLMVPSKTMPMFRALDVGSTVASPTVIECNVVLGRCLACRTRSLSLFNWRLFKSIHLFSSHKQTSTLVHADTTSSTLVVFMLRYSRVSSAYMWNPTPWRRRIVLRGRYRPSIGLGPTQTPGENRRSVDDQKNRYLWFARTVSDWTGKTQTKCRQSPAHQRTGRDAIVGCRVPMCRTLLTGPTVSTSHTFHRPVHITHRNALTTVLIQCYGPLYKQTGKFLQVCFLVDGKWIDSRLPSRSTWRGTSGWRYRSVILV